MRSNRSEQSVRRPTDARMTAVKNHEARPAPRPPGCIVADRRPTTRAPRPPRRRPARRARPARRRGRASGRFEFRYLRSNEIGGYPFDSRLRVSFPGPLLSLFHVSRTQCGPRDPTEDPNRRYLVRDPVQRLPLTECWVAGESWRAEANHTQGESVTELQWDCNDRIAKPITASSPILIRKIRRPALNV